LHHFLFASFQKSECKYYLLHNRTFCWCPYKLNRKLKDASRKLAKNKLDLIFLTKCKTYDVWCYNQASSHFHEKICFLGGDFVSMQGSLIVEEDHENKLRDLRINSHLDPVYPEKVVHKFSSAKLPVRLKFLLAFSVHFNLPVYHLDFSQFYSHWKTSLSFIQRKLCW